MKFVVINAQTKEREEFHTRKEAEDRYDELTSLAGTGGNGTRIKQKAYVVQLPD